ncbi:MAG: hypothetical protein ACYCU8_00455 [Ferrimicrobium acidiphilum]
MNRKTVLSMSALLSLPLALAACGSTASSEPAKPVTPQAAVEAAYHQAVTSPNSYHLTSTVTTTHNGALMQTTTISGNVYDSLKPNGSYGALTVATVIPGQSNEGSMSEIIDNGNLYINATGFRFNGVHKINGWISIPIVKYHSDLSSNTKSSFFPLVSIHQSELLGSLLKSGKFVSAGTTTLAGQKVDSYKLTLTVAQLAHAASGTMAKGIVRTMEAFSVKAPITFTVDVGSGNRVAFIGTTFPATIFKIPVTLTINQQCTNYGVKFSVSPPKNAKPVTSLSVL